MIGQPPARQTLLRGGGLPSAWAAQPQWRILETGFGAGLNFLATWDAWRRDPARPRLLHYLAVDDSPVTAADLQRAATGYPEFAPLIQALAAQWFGLVPGVHRLSFEAGRVLLTLHVGRLDEVVRRQPFTADAVCFSGSADPACWELPAIKALARHCRRGARVSGAVPSAEARSRLVKCGFVLDPPSGDVPSEAVQGEFSPRWEPRNSMQAPYPATGHCVVVGSGLAGAAAAASLARRGWRVTVLDAQEAPAAGASGVPVGLLAPHYSPDDNLLSRLSRAGVRATLREAQTLLQEGDEWRLCGALEHRTGERRGPPDIAQSDVWSRAADAGAKRQALLDADSQAIWHDKAAWVKPLALVRAWLATPGVQWRGQAKVHRLSASGGEWLLRGADNEELARADLVVLACAIGTIDLAPADLALHPVRGQIAWAGQEAGQLLPPFAVNGNGHFIPGVPIGQGVAWFCGSTYAPGDGDTAHRAEDQQANFARLESLLPAVAQRLAPAFAAGKVQAWSGVRCASSHRRPLLGQVQPGLWVATAMGSRGLTFAHLCAEVMAARLHDEPLPIEARLAQALAPARPQLDFL